MIATKGWVKNLLGKVLKKTVNNYSLEEQKIGTWVDGKPLYQKTIDFTTPETADSIESLLDCPSDYDYITITEGCIITDASIIFVNSNINEGNYFNAFVRSAGNGVSPNTIAINVGSNVTNCQAYITIRYTKTIDTAII